MNFCNIIFSKYLYDQFNRILTKEAPLGYKSFTVFHYVFYQENVQMHMKIKNKNQWIASSRED